MSGKTHDCQRSITATFFQNILELLKVPNAPFLA
jgi:hypothetical protein